MLFQIFYAIKCVILYKEVSSQTLVSIVCWHILFLETLIASVRLLWPRTEIYLKLYLWGSLGSYSRRSCGEKSFGSLEPQGWMLRPLETSVLGTWGGNWVSPLFLSRGWPCSSLLWTSSVLRLHPCFSTSRLPEEKCSSQPQGSWSGRWAPLRPAELRVTRGILSRRQEYHW